jgi:PilZ domain
MQDRRTFVRHRTFIKGRISFNNGLSSVDCTVRDLGDSGARLEVPETVALPDVFELHLPNKDEYFHAKVAWRKGNSLGVSWALEQSAGPGGEHGALESSFADRLAKLEREVASLKKRLEGHNEL